MLRSCSAASPNKLYTSGYKFARVARHVLGRTEINISSFNRARDAGVWLRRDRLGSGGANSFNCFEHSDGPNTAITADHIRSPLLETWWEGLGSCAGEAVGFLLPSDLS